MIKLAEIEELHNFEPIYTFSDLQQHLPQSFDSRVQDAQLFKAIRTLTEKAYPSQENSYDKRWLDFYLPVKRRGYLILIPLGIVLYDERFFLSFPHSQIEVCKGKEKNEFFLGLIAQVLEFSRILKKDPGIVTKAVPNDIRTGRVLGKYVLEDLLPAEKKEKIVKLYRDHVERKERSHGVSLNDYLNTAAICYKAAFGSKTNGLTGEQMYRRWADVRDCGMLKIRKRNGKEDFSHWLNNNSDCGGHPFEIVFSWHEHGIHLIPPRRTKQHFTLRVTNYMYAMPYLEMVKALIRNGIPFEAYKLESVLDYLSGESYFTVNDHGEHSIIYDAGNRRLVKHIKWDEPKTVRWK